jgi:sodium transport system ATP-binding protein
MVEVHGLQKRYGDVTAVRDVSFTAADGRITGLLGANGAGKTTTLGMICGVLRPDAGTIRIDAEDSSARNQGRRRLGALLDHRGLYPRLTARENIRYFGQLHRIPGEDLETRVAGTVALLGLDAVADRRVAGFSEGERLKVALGRVLVHSPGNILLDEPTNGLDVPAVRAFRSLLAALRDRGSCIIFSSHVLAEVGALCDHAVILSRGCVVAQGEPSDICDRTGCTSLEDALVRVSNPTEMAS